MENQTIVTLKKGEGRYLRAGGLWIFDNEIAAITGRFKNGSVVTVQDADGRMLGRGFINQNSKIRIRILTRDARQEIDTAFWRTRVQNAWDYRKRVLRKTYVPQFPAQVAEILRTGLGNLDMAYMDVSACRLIFGEADFFPGLVVDKYADTLVVQCLALGMEAFRDEIIGLVKQALAADGIEIRGVYERSDARERKKEGLLPVKRFLGAEFDPKVEIVENGVRYLVDVENGQKTGFFLDQKYNRLAMQRLCTGRRVLDCFTHMGTFALNAGLAGADSVVGLDISAYAVAQAEENARRNGLQERVRFRCANVMEELPRLAAAGERFDVVILDPPAFTKSREATKNAIRGYRELNINGMKVVADGGYLATCSCSHFMTQELFAQTIREAARAAHKRLRQVEFRTQAMDHPILWAADESYYLKFFIFQCVDDPCPRVQEDRAVCTKWEAGECKSN